ncbi:MAG: hypothetical protein WC729_13110 [Sphingomonas sp.]|uniref:hypothetical protein n=1 Tax=Sphingomonas sp. TaxID=28214 RepID=UPI0035671361
MPDSLLPLIDLLPIGRNAPGLQRMAATLPFSSYIALELTSGETDTMSLCAHVPPRKGEWRRFHPRILAACLDEDAACAGFVQSVYLEFDAPYGDAPGVFVGLRNDLPAREAAVRAVAGIVVPGTQVPHDLAPHVSHVAAMPARSPSLLRLNLLAAGILCVAPLEQLAASVADVTSHCVGSVDVTHGVLSDRVGMECYVKDWERFFGICRQRGWCSDADVARWLSWPGEAAGPVVDDLPDWARWTGQLLNARSGVVRTLNHAKLVARPDHPVEMKIYPAVHHVWH